MLSAGIESLIERVASVPALDDTQITQRGRSEMAMGPITSLSPDLVVVLLDLRRPLGSWHYARDTDYVDQPDVDAPVKFIDNWS